MHPNTHSHQTSAILLTISNLTSPMHEIITSNRHTRLKLLQCTCPTWSVAIPPRHLQVTRRSLCQGFLDESCQICDLPFHVLYPQPGSVVRNGGRGRKRRPRPRSGATRGQFDPVQGVGIIQQLGITVEEEV